ncbi:Ig-like domain-containing domain [Pontibacter silvestris]|uniref:Ig-like domain-containing domain n=1 Tax=Pontibacter silvestris TaxID=2305183 RepID=A0ABW4X2E8_9BACT|nr:Ig-like domain-containing domain [Pontibacter silvestris]MCC9135672.1 Ig-like domain-containing protein [Pontibacter silvestris]
MTLRQILLTVATIGALNSCATINTPEGGERDLVPPKLVSSTPKDQQLNVKTNTVTLTFDEEVQPNNLTRELLITPNTQNKYTVNSKREQLTLEFDNQLQDSTTFTFNFRKGVQDITEKNVAQGLKIAFSTGSFIDSSRVSGTVVDLLTQVPEKEAVVALYPTNDTLNVRKNRPYYQTQTDSAGNYNLENIKEGEYRLYAIVDKNNNSFYDNENEKIAYLDTTVYVAAQEQNVKLQTIKIDTKKPILMQRETYADRFRANYNEGIRSFLAKPLGNANDTLAHKINTNGKAAELFKTTNYTGGKTILSAVDSAGNIATDTIEISFQGKIAQQIKGAQLKVINSRSSNGYKPDQQVTIEFQTPITITGAAPVSILADSITLTTLKYPKEIMLDRTATELSFTFPKLENRNKNLSLVIDSTAIVPIEGERLQFPVLPLSISESKGTGSISGKVTSNYTNFVLQLINKDFKPVQELKDVQSRFEFKNVDPETYRIRVLVDENNDGTWYSGDPNLEKKPEKVYIYPEAIQVRANWIREDVNLEF